MLYTMARRPGRIASGLLFAFALVFAYEGIADPCASGVVQKRILVFLSGTFRSAGISKILRDAGYQVVTPEECRKTSCDLTLIDLRNSAERLEQASQWISEQTRLRRTVSPVLLLSEEAESVIDRVVEFRAEGVVNEVNEDSLLKAISLVIEGETVIPRSLFHELLDQTRPRSRPMIIPHDCPIGPRELEVLSLAGEGLSNQEIAMRLGITLHTVKNHMHHIFEKMGTTGRVRAYQEALQRNWFR